MSLPVASYKLKSCWTQNTLQLTLRNSRLLTTIGLPLAKSFSSHCQTTLNTHTFVFKVQFLSFFSFITFRNVDRRQEESTPLLSKKIYTPHSITLVKSIFVSICYYWLNLLVEGLCLNWSKQWYWVSLAYGHFNTIVHILKDYVTTANTWRKYLKSRKRNPNYHIITPLLISRRTQQGLRLFIVPEYC